MIRWEMSLLAKLNCCREFDLGKQLPSPPSPQPACLSWARSSLIALALSHVSPELRNPPAIICIPVPGMAEMLLEKITEALRQQKSCSPCCLSSDWSVLFSPAWNFVSGWVISPAIRRDGKVPAFSKLKIHLHHVGPT